MTDGLMREVEGASFAASLYEAAKPVWEAGLRQPFLTELAEGTLERERFAFYLKQDYLYLDDYAKVHALAFAKCDDAQIGERLANTIMNVAREKAGMHDYYRRAYGITPEELATARQSAFARAYTTNILTTAYTKPLVDILIAVLPCAWVYADYGTRLSAEYGDRLEGNPYRQWIETYRTDDFWQSSVWLIEALERLTAGMSESRLAELRREFVVGVEHEYMFWSSAYDLQQSWRPEWNTLA